MKQAWATTQGTSTLGRELERHPSLPPTFHAPSALHVVNVACRGVLPCVPWRQPEFLAELLANRRDKEASSLGRAAYTQVVKGSVVATDTTLAFVALTEVSARKVFSGMSAVNLGVWGRGRGRVVFFFETGCGSRSRF